MNQKEGYLSYKKGVLMDLVLVFTVLIFCSIVILLFFRVDNNLSASLISPNEVLDLTSERISFEISEGYLLREVYCERTEKDEDEIKKGFCNQFNSIDNVNFLRSNTQPREGLNLRLDNICNLIYDFDLDNEELRVFRSGLIKNLELEAIDEKSENRFSMNLEFKLEKEYLLTQKDCY
jgi:hypothetical protein